MGPEALIIETDPHVRRVELLRLRDMGVLDDDDGSGGYANTSALLDTPATGGKTDRSIISQIIADQRARLLLTNVTKLATDLAVMDVVEEHFVGNYGMPAPLATHEAVPDPGEVCKGERYRGQGRHGGGWSLLDRWVRPGSPLPHL